MCLRRDNQKQIDDAVLPLKTKLEELQVRVHYICSDISRNLVNIIRCSMIYIGHSGESVTIWHINDFFFGQSDQKGTFAPKNRFTVKAKIQSALPGGAKKEE